tara:strand:- start:321 stop:1151 length:831 start_codon:yes stop_codon:yes gene_type:complete
MFNKNPSIDSNEKYYIVDNIFDSKVFKNLTTEFKNKVERIDSWHEEYCKITKDKGRTYQRVLDAPIRMNGGTSDSNSYKYMTKLFENDENFSRLLKSLNNTDVIKKLIPNLSINNLRIRDKSTKIGLFQKIFYSNVYLSLKIARYQNGSGIGLHTDTPEKIVAMLFYFGYSDDVVRNNGGTQIYEKATNKTINSHEYLNHSDFDLIEDVAPLPNRAMGFNVSKKSWHGVSPLTGIPKDVYRDTFQLNLMKCTNYSNGLLVLTTIKNKIMKLIGTWK